MGISVLSPPATSSGSVSSTGALSGALPLPASGLQIDFAALLTGQIIGLQPETATMSLTSSEKSADKDTPQTISDLLAPQDPALSPQIALSYSAPPLYTEGSTPKNDTPLALAPTSLPNTEKAFTAAAEKALSAGNDASASRLAELKTPSTTLGTTNTPQSAAPVPLAAGNAEAAILAGDNISSGNSTTQTFASLLAPNSAAPAQSVPHGNPTAIPTPLQDSRWPQDLGERIVWMAKNDQQHAQINITPAQLGPVQITLSLNGDQASIAFASPHADVRKAIEEAMPNLREMLSTSGINLGQSDVGSELKQQQPELARQFANGQRSTGETAILPADSHIVSRTSGQPIQQGRGLVDLFA